jgi:hypothetical protein
MIKQNLEVLSVGGYALSGGTAVRDLIKEFQEYCYFETEFRLIKDPYGLLDLENHLIDNWRDQLNSDIAIKDFIWLVENLNRISRKISKIGMGYSKKISSNFISITEEYINEISQFTYKGNWHLLRFKRGYLTQIIDKFKIKFNIQTLENIYYSKPTQENFTDSTKKYLDKLFSVRCKEKGVSKILLHNAIPTYDPFRAMRYFDNVKMIIVDRDPRDIYVDIINKKITWFLGSEFIKNRDVNLFIENFKSRRNHFIENSLDRRVLNIKFENLVLDYDKTYHRIKEFLNLSDGKNDYKGTFFNPKNSIHNIGLWKKYEFQDEVNLIFENLKDYCFQEEIEEQK